jgi:hypothetical protein
VLKKKKTAGLAILPWSMNFVDHDVVNKAVVVQKAHLRKDESVHAHWGNIDGDGSHHIR